MPCLLALVAFAMITGHHSVNDDPAPRPAVRYSLIGPDDELLIRASAITRDEL